MKKSTVYFSVIVPIYNLEKVLDRLIKSVLSQTFKDFELILVNDGSTDKSLDIINFYSNLDDRIKIVNKKNGGVSSARNSGLYESIGKYIYFLDGDDEIENDLLEYAYNLFSNNKIDMFAFGFEYVDTNNNVIKDYSIIKYNNKVFNGIDYLKLFLLKKMYISVCSSIIKSDLIFKNNLFFDEDTKEAEDIEFMIKVMSLCNEIYYSSNKYFRYYKRKNSATNKKILKKDFEVYHRIGNYAESIAPVEIKQYKSYWFVNFYKNIIFKGSDKKTVSQFIKLDYILEDHKLRFNKFSIVTFIFTISYKIYLKKYLLKKYEIEVF